LSKAYELLGVKPGVSNAELKSAHRDLAKVWHPDRFLHDPRLQEKAQEKLKEINEAYELLSSGKTPRPARVPPPSRPAAVRYTAAASSTPRPKSSWRWIAVPLLIFAAVFSITIRALLTQRTPVVQEESSAQVETANAEHVTPADANGRVKVNETPARSSEQNSASEAASSETQAAEPTPAVATVTVLIDPESGLLAKPDCPLRSRMTYPITSAPTGHCNINHAPAPPKESRIKSFAKRVGRSLDQANP